MSAGPPMLDVYRRPDGKWDWRLIVNGRIVATSGTQGYERKHRAREMGIAVTTGDYWPETLRSETRDSVVVENFGEAVGI